MHHELFISVIGIWNMKVFLDKNYFHFISFSEAFLGFRLSVGLMDWLGFCGEFFLEEAFKKP
jgi:hypothetical protein